MIKTILLIATIFFIVAITLIILYIFFNFWEIVNKFINTEQTIKNNKLLDYYSNKQKLDKPKPNFNTKQNSTVKKISNRYS